LEAIL